MHHRTGMSESYRMLGSSGRELFSVCDLMAGADGSSQKALLFSFHRRFSPRCLVLLFTRNWIDQRRIVDSSPHRLQIYRRQETNHETVGHHVGNCAMLPCVCVLLLYVSPAAMAWPPNLVNRPGLSVATASNRSRRCKPGTERPEPLIVPGSCAGAKAITGRWACS